MKTFIETSLLKGINLKNRKWLWYGIYCFALIIIFLYILFPSEVLKGYMINRAGDVYPDLKVKLNDISLSFPVGIQIEGLGISLEKDPDVIIYNSDNTNIRPGILSYFAGSRKYYFQSSTMGGNISGYLKNKVDNGKNGITAKVIFKEIHLDNRVFIHPVINRRVEGTARGEINFKGDLASPVDGDFDVSLELSKGKLKLLNPILQLSEIVFDKATLKAEMKNNIMEISSAELAGNGLKAMASGTVRLNNNFLTSRLDLKGEIEFSSTFFKNMPDVGEAVSALTGGREDGKLSFNLRGTIEKPRFNLNQG